MDDEHAVLNGDAHQIFIKNPRASKIHGIFQLTMVPDLLTKVVEFSPSDRDPFSKMVF